MYKILIVDDEEYVRHSIASLLDWEKFDCTIIGEASSGEEALEMIRENQPDLVLTDIMMPFIDGIELTYRLKEEFPEIKVVFLSGYEEFEFAKKGIELEVLDYILKPFGKETFEQKIKMIICKLKTKQKESFYEEIQEGEKYFSKSEAITQYLEKNYHNPDLSLITIAKAFSFSPKYFSMYFKKSTGANFSDYLTSIRIKKAKYMLVFSEMKTYEIAYHCGFSDAHYFSRVFKKYIGMSPSAYRKGRKEVKNEEIQA